MQFTPKTEDQIKRFSTLPDGDYPFTVLESKEQASKSQKNYGKIMCALKLAVHRPDGGDQWVYDYFADWFSEWKLKHFAETCGQSASYDAGILDVADNAAQGWQGMVRIITEVDNNGKERNAVDDYIVAEKPKAEKPKPAAPNAKAGFLQVKAEVDNSTDDVPF